MKLPKRGQKGFTLIELLIVVAILGVLAAVVIPNIQQFIGAGETEARETDFTTIQSSVHAMMLDNEISSIPGAVAWTDSTTGAENDMTAFPDATSSDAVPAGDPGKVTDPEGYDYDFTVGVGDDNPGYVLYGHDITGNDATTPNPNQGDADYVAMSTSEYYYTCETDGTVRQWETADCSEATGNEYEY